jgi:hypothetical protein
MKQHRTPRFIRAVASLLCATAFVATPALAQETQAAPPVVVTPPQSATVPPPPVVRTVPDAPSASTPAAEPAARPLPRAAARPAATRTVTRTQTSRPTPTRVAAPAAPVVASPAPQPAAPAQPVASAPAPAAPVTAPPAAPVAAGTASTQTTTTSAVPLWAWIGGGLAALAILLVGVFALRRRRVDDYDYAEEPYVEEAYVEPVAVAPVVEPLAVAAVAPRKEPEFLQRTQPAAIEQVAVAPDEVKMVDTDAAEVAALTAGSAPVAERPWLEFAMRPVRAGTNVDEALVEIELTVGNSGTVPAKDVRISTFLLSSDPNGSEMERVLIDPPVDATTDPVTIGPGEGKRIDATLALLKSDMGENLPASFRPIVVADARYTLADGSEGRTSASFEIGVTPEEGEGLDPIELSRSSMHENVGAELHGEPLRA